MIKKRARGLWMAACILMLSAALCLRRVRAQQNYSPPPQSVIPQLFNMPPGQQALILGGRIDQLEKDMYETTGRQQNQYPRISTLEGQIKPLLDEQNKKDTQQASQFFWSLLNSGATGGVILYHVKQNKRRRRSSDESEDD